MPKGIPGSGPKRQTAIIEPASPTDSIRHIIEHFGHDVSKVAQLEIRSNGVVRVLGTDRSLRSHRLEWPESEPDAKEDA